MADEIPMPADVRLRMREFWVRVYSENGVDVIRRVLSTDRVHKFVSVPPKLAVRDPIRKM